MGDKSKIEWTDATWNPVTGCDKVSPGCANCYAERLAERFRGVKGSPYEQGFDLRLWPDRLEIPLRWKKPRLIFVNSMSDLFHKSVGLNFIQDVFRVMNKAQQHTFQVLTKRPERLRELGLVFSIGKLWTPNIWMGVSIENANYTYRAEILADTEAAIKFLSVEPLLGPIDNLPLKNIDWVIVGGESGPGARPMHPDWVRSIRDQCIAADVPFFFKQHGGTNKKATGRELDGRTWDEMPKAFRSGA